MWLSGDLGSGVRGTHATVKFMLPDGKRVECGRSTGQLARKVESQTYHSS